MQTIAITLPVVPSRPMTKHARGEAVRGQILVELRRRRDAWEPEPSLVELGVIIGKDQQTVFYHLGLLREAGLVHPSAVLVTPKGYGVEN